MHSKSATEVILTNWNRLNSLPGGRWIFNQFLRRFNPYSGSIHPKVLKLRPGYAKIELKDRRQIRNHLNSIHALALANLGELTSGLALLSALPDNGRGIPIKISTEYFKKARGKLVAESKADLPVIDKSINFEASSEILDQQGDVVARTIVNWRLGLIE